MSGDNNAYGGAGSATQFTPTAIGQYTFVASYSGDSPNTNAAGPSACDDVNEQVTVGGTAAFTTEQDWLPNDTATLTGDTNLTGDLTFTLFSNGTCDDTDPDADIYSETIEVNDAPSGTAFSTDNDSVTVSASGTFSWLVTYVDDNLADPAPSCLETTALTIDNDGPDPTP